MSETSATLGKRARVPIFIVLVLLAASVIYPLYFLITSSFRPQADYLQNPLGLPGEWTINNFLVLLINNGAGRAFLNSLIVVTVALAIVLVLATLAAYALAKLPVPGGRVIQGAFLSVMLIPAQVLILPLFLLLTRIGLIGSYPGLILVYVAFNLPFAVFFLTVTFREIPDEVLDASRVDGAGFFRTVWSIITPMGSSGIATLAVLQFLAMWNELLLALVLMPGDLKLLTPTLAGIGNRFENNQPLVSAGLLFSAIVPMLMLAFASRYIMRGLAVGVSR
jgi:ABC-type glycerol-3-phosphate transport system permease component